MKLYDFDYYLPQNLIAQHPLPVRDASRMLLVDRSAYAYRDLQFVDLPGFLSPGDVVVLNNTRVFPARLSGTKLSGGAQIEVFLIRQLNTLEWEALARPARRLRKGSRLLFGGGRLSAEVKEKRSDGFIKIVFANEGPTEYLIEEIGETPLPPYIRREKGPTAEDRRRYQTVYASALGAIAAPTAGLHLTRRTLAAIGNRGASIVELTLHVGYGTFEPVRVEDVRKHRVRPEWFEITQMAADKINEARSRGSRVLAIGTTTTRALEAAQSHGYLSRTSGLAELTIVPGYDFKIVNALFTNFHLPRSSLLLLVSAFTGRELTLEAYRHAVRACYRFYSYGDSMLII
jgi:S-adenosylmethionine:tRNA ribosyltransferase-isomerase